MPLQEIESIVESSSRKLLRTSSPPVRYWLLTQVMDMDERDAAVQQALRQCEDYPPKLALLSKLREDGTWPIPRHKKYAEDVGPGPPIGWTFRTMLWNLYTLAEYRTKRREGNVDASLKRLLSWQSPEGYILGPWTDAFPLPYFNAHAAHHLLRFGLERNVRAQRMISWLESVQRHDGGWNMPFLNDVYYTPEFRGMRSRDFISFIRDSDKSRFDLSKFNDTPSCIWSTLLVTWAFVESPTLAKSKRVKAAAEFVIDGFFKKNYHNTFYMSPEHWTKLRYPARFGSGLMALDVLTRIGFGPDDRRMEKPIAWLMSARSPGGMWSQSERPHPDRDQWITLTALRSLKRYAANR